MADVILVTGGAGYIGSHTCKELFLAGYTPVVFDNLSTGHGYAIKWGPFVHADLRDKEKLEAAFEQYQPKAVIHFAADAIVSESIINPAKTYLNNLANTLSLLDAMRKFHVKKIVFSSTCAVYGDPKTHPVTETHPIQPINPYGRSKWMNEEIIHDFEKAYGVEAVILRYFNAAGADLETQIGENHYPETHLIPSIIQAALGVKNEIVVYGTDFPSKDGSAVRDYIHVKDLALAHIKALDIASDTINLGTGMGFSVLEIIDMVQKYCGKSLRISLKERRKGEAGILSADNTKAKEKLGWTPQYSELSTIVESAWKWHQLLSENTHLLKTVIKC